jgi:hypothetical protein
MSILTNFTPLFADASAENFGAIARHGPHHAAVKYASTRGFEVVKESRDTVSSSTWNDEVVDIARAPPRGTNTNIRDIGVRNRDAIV